MAIGRLVCLAILILAPLKSGCGVDDGLGRVAVSGVVRLDGAPLDSGSLMFDPAEESVGTAVGATIQGGRFAIPRQAGPVPGRYRIRIYASSGVQAPPGPGQTERSARPMIERIPPAYNARTGLLVEVTREGRNEWEWDLVLGREPGPSP